MGVKCWRLRFLSLGIQAMCPLSCARAQVARRAHARKLGAYINVASRKCFLHIFHMHQKEFRWVVVKCCIKEILCAHRLKNACKGVWPVLSCVVSSSHRQCTVGVLVMAELAMGPRWNRNCESLDLNPWPSKWQSHMQATTLSNTNW